MWVLVLHHVVKLNSILYCNTLELFITCLDEYITAYERMLTFVWFYENINKHLLRNTFVLFDFLIGPSLLELRCEIRTWLEGHNTTGRDRRNAHAQPK